VKVHLWVEPKKKNLENNDHLGALCGRAEKGGDAWLTRKKIPCPEVCILGGLKKVTGRHSVAEKILTKGGKISRENRNLPC